jgi:hypothetical protein
MLNSAQNAFERRDEKVSKGANKNVRLRTERRTAAWRFSYIEIAGMPESRIGRQNVEGDQESQMAEKQERWSQT